MTTDSGCVADYERVDEVIEVASPPVLIAAGCGDANQNAEQLVDVTLESDGADVAGVGEERLNMGDDRPGLQFRLFIHGVIQGQRAQQVGEVHAERFEFGGVNGWDVVPAHVSEGVEHVQVSVAQQGWETPGFVVEEQELDPLRVGLSRAQDTSAVRFHSVKDVVDFVQPCGSSPVLGHIGGVSADFGGGFPVNIPAGEGAVEKRGRVFHGLSIDRLIREAA